MFLIFLNFEIYIPPRELIICQNAFIIWSIFSTPHHPLKVDFVPSKRTNNINHYFDSFGWKSSFIFIIKGATKAQDPPPFESRFFFSKMRAVIIFFTFLADNELRFILKGTTRAPDSPTPTHWKSIISQNSPKISSIFSNLAPFESLFFSLKTRQ